MTARRDPDIMAMDHAMRAIRKSTPRMLRSNIEFLIFLLNKLWIRNEVKL